MMMMPPSSSSSSSSVTAAVAEHKKLSTSELSPSGGGGGGDGRTLASLHNSLEDADDETSIAKLLASRRLKKFHPYDNLEYTTLLGPPPRFNGPVLFGSSSSTNSSKLAVPITGECFLIKNSKLAF